MSLSEVRAGRIPNSMKTLKPKVLNDQKEKDHKISLNFLIKYKKLDSLISMNIQNLVPRSYLSKNGLDENQIIVLSLLRDKSYQLFKDYTKEFESHETKAKQLIQSGHQIKKYEITKELFILIKKTILEILEKHALSVFQMIRELPGFQQFNRNDLNILVKNNFFFLFGIRTKSLCKNDDYFLFIDDIPLNRNTLGIIAGEKVRDNIFEFNSHFRMLNLTDQEFGLLIPFFLSISSNFI